MRRGRRDWIAVVCAAFIVIIVSVAVFAPWLAPHDPNQVDILGSHEGPSSAHPLGTDSLGRDLLSRLIYGARLSLIGPALIVVLATVVGTALAIIAAWMGGWPDNLISRVLDILFAFPGLIFAILAVALFGPGLMAPVIALSIAYLPFDARILRSVAMRERALPYIEACYIEGLPTRRITLGHLLPNILPFVLVQATLSFGYALVDLAAISYLGLGVAPPASEWGLMVANGQASILTGHPQESIYAGLMIVITVVAFNVLGDRLATRVLGEGHMTPLLHIDDLHVELPVGDELRPVLYDTTLTVDAGEALGLVGESGAGKSMTARAVLRLLPPGAQVSGQVLFDGKDVLGFGREERCAASSPRTSAMIFQDPTHAHQSRAQDRRLPHRGPAHDQRRR